MKTGKLITVVLLAAVAILVGALVAALYPESRRHLARVIRAAVLISRSSTHS